MKPTTNLHAVASLESMSIYLTVQDANAPHISECICRLSLPDALTLREELDRAIDRELEHIAEIS